MEGSREGTPGRRNGTGTSMEAAAHQDHLQLGGQEGG